MENEKEGFPITALREIRILQLLRHENIVNLVCWLIFLPHHRPFYPRVTFAFKLLMFLLRDMKITSHVTLRPNSAPYMTLVTPHTVSLFYFNGPLHFNPKFQIEICRTKATQFNKHKSTFYLVFDFCEHDLAGLLSNFNVKFSLGEIKKV